MKIKATATLFAFASAITATTEAGPGPTQAPFAESRKVATKQVIISCPRCQPPVVINRAAIITRGVTQAR